MKTLYVSDLDGTLLRSDQKTSDYTNRVINELVGKGMLFSYATARSYNTSHKVTDGMTARCPLVVYNGAVVRDSLTGEIMIQNLFDRDLAVTFITELLDAGVSPIVYSFDGGREYFTYLTEEINEATRDFILTRAGDDRDRPAYSRYKLLSGDIFYVACIGEEDKLQPFYDRYAGRCRCVYQKDIYSGEPWLELMPLNATKSAAIARLKELLGCDRLVVFGDGVNDRDMFAMADEAYAVANAVPELKAAADGIIGSNDDDGVARWLEEHFTEE